MKANHEISDYKVLGYSEQDKERLKARNEVLDRLSKVKLKGSPKRTLDKQFDTIKTGSF